MGLVSSCKWVVGCNPLPTRFLRKNFMGVIWVLCDLVKKGIKKMKIGLGIIPFYFRLGFFSKNLSLGKKGVCDIRKKRKEYENKLYFESCNGKWLMDSNVSCSCLVLLRG